MVSETFVIIVYGVDGEGGCPHNYSFVMILFFSQLANLKSSLHDGFFDAIVGECDCDTGVFFPARDTKK